VTTQRQFPEASLSAPVQRWLAEAGYAAYVEVPMFERTVDIIGLAGEPGKEVIIAVELKTSLTEAVRLQALGNNIFANTSYCAVATTPRKASLDDCRKLRLGVLQVKGENVIRQVHAFRHGGRVFLHYQKQCLEQHSRMQPGGIAGMPQLAGEGPAQDVARRIAKYREKHPKATWRELFEMIPHHYSSPHSMVGAMASLRDRLLLAAR